MENELISRQAAIDAIERNSCNTQRSIEAVQALPSVQPVDKDINVSCKDAISRQAAIDALAKFVPYAICDESTESYTNGLTDAYNLILQLPSAQPEPCSDAISRQAAIDALTEYGNGRAVYISAEEAVRRIEQLPPAQPEIIHCKDCKWFGDIGCAIEIVDDSDKPTENDFCSFAERRTDGTEQP